MIMEIKNRILNRLKENREYWTSGEDLSITLNLTRTAVWKHIQSLRNEGYVIESSSKKGYRLMKIPDVLTSAEILDGLATKTFGKTGFYYMEEAGSTNQEAAALAENGAPEGTVVIADHQSRGRGRKQRNWFSPPGTGIYISLVLKPPITPAEAPRITLLAAVAGAETLRHLTGLDISIKWPNDLLVNGKKISGILTEMSAGMDAVNHIIVGIGINVNTSNESLPDEIRDIATSARAETGSVHSRSSIVRSLLEYFELYYDLFLRGEFHKILTRWKELSGIIGRKIQVDGINSRISGTVLDVNDDGVLILKDGEGVIHRVFSGDVILPR